MNTIETIIKTAEKFRSSYFWSSPGNAGECRSYEKKYSVDPITFDWKGDTYSFAYSVECSCRNIYAQGCYYKNGNKTTLTTVKNLYRKMQAEMEANVND